VTEHRNQEKMDYNIITEPYVIKNKPLGKRFPDRRIKLSTYMGKGELPNENQLFYVEESLMDTRQN
jgi:hypothetical protein